MAVSYVMIPFVDHPEDGKSRAFTRSNIRNGKIVWGPRNCGKTQALLEVVHEDCAGDASVVCVDSREARIYDYRYREMFPGEPGPKVISSQTCDLEGRRNVFVDGLSRMRQSDRERLLASCRVVRGVD
jgi:hypothetical protein